ncbi:nucleotidyltransferase domain-containing protein [Pseudoxanthomonas sp. PXM03]|nr:nucleotidyltransferase domain-containing protein [Pseudoxanthomonas sp. PXM03]
MIREDVEVAIFGSVARGENDAKSDLDVIAVVNNASGISKEALRSEIQSFFNERIGLSIYGRRRIEAMWEDGSPFAWHLYSQARPIKGFRSDFLTDFGAPSSYENERADCLMMRDIATSSEARLSGRVLGCECYEAGLLYVAARNVGMFSSLRISGEFNFSRMAPYALPGKFSLPLDSGVYKSLIEARHASNRGYSIPDLNGRVLAECAKTICHWIDNILKGG